MNSTTASPTTGSTTASTTSTQEDSTTAPSSSSTSTTASPPGSSSQTPTAPTPPDDAEDDDSPNKEAAKYRRRLRDTETERDRLSAENGDLRSQLERFHDGKLTEALGGRVNLAALRGLGADLTGIVRSDGTVDTDRAGELLREHEISPKVGGYVPQSGTGENGAGKGGPTWGDAIRQRSK